MGERVGREGCCQLAHLTPVSGRRRLIFLWAGTSSPDNSFFWGWFRKPMKWVRCCLHFAISYPGLGPSGLEGICLGWGTVEANGHPKVELIMTIRPGIYRKIRIYFNVAIPKGFGCASLSPRSILDMKCSNRICISNLLWSSLVEMRILFSSWIAEIFHFFTNWKIV